MNCKSYGVLMEPRGDGWTLTSDGRNVLHLGTPAWIIGAYEYSTEH